jgi:hypothetical protein
MKKFLLMKVITNCSKLFLRVKSNGLEPKYPIGSCVHHKMFGKYVKGSLCVNGQKSKSYENEKKMI